MYRKGKCIINKDKKKECAVGESDENPDAEKKLFCASIKLKKARVIQGKRTLRPMLCSPDSAALEYIIYSFANERSYFDYCKKCVNKEGTKGTDKCDTFNCIASVYGGFTGLKNPENEDTRKEKDEKCNREQYYDFSRRWPNAQEILTWGEGHD